jgi:hypothetical protein
MPGFNKILYAVLSLILTAFIALIAMNVWRSHAYIKEQGAEGVLVIGHQYNASRWAEPLPLKKLHVYTATLAPNYQVVIETDQSLAPRSQVFIRHLALNDRAVDRLDGFLRPVSGRIRIRTSADGAPVVADPTAPLDKAVNKAMGNPQAAPVPGAFHAPDLSKNAAVFLIGGAKDGTLELIWNNSGPAEWIALFLALFLLQSFAINAWTLPWRERKPCDEEKGFVHPSLETIEADAPRAPVAKIAFKPKPKDPAESPAAAAEEAAPERTLKLPRK